MGKASSQRYRSQGIRREWTEAEFRRLKRHFFDMTLQELQAHHFPHRTLRAVQRMAHKLGLRKRQLRRKSEYRPWSADELRLVARHYPALKAPEIQRCFLPHRSVTAIRHAAKRFGLKAFSVTRWTEQDLAILRRDFPLGGTPRVKRALPHRSEEAIKFRARAEGVCYVAHGDGDKGDAWSAEELRRLEEHRHLPAEELARLFPRRAKRAVINKRYKLQWSPVKQWSEAELQCLRDHLGAPLESLCRLFPDRPREGIRIKRDRLRRSGR